MIYDEDRYLTRGRFAKSRFERNWLSEYAEFFKTVCVYAGIAKRQTASVYLQELEKLGILKDGVSKLKMKMLKTQGFSHVLLI
jgi:hypothetical protein